MKRSLMTDDPSDGQFKSGSSFPVALAVWDGSNVERNGMKGISTWFTVQMPNYQKLETLQYCQISPRPKDLSKTIVRGLGG